MQAVAENLPPNPPRSSGSAAFKVQDTTKQIWWLKALNNPQGPRVPINEVIVGMAGKLIGAPVCQVTVVEVLADAAGVTYQGNLQLQPGFHSGSKNVAAVVEIKGALADRDKDDNARRHAGLFAVYDWCWGSDPQYLYSEDEDRRTYSHDHGHYFPNGPNWTMEQLASTVDTPHPLDAPQGLDPKAILDFANHLKEVSHDDIGGILNGIPESWPVTTQELETMGWYLERRACAVASRLEKLAGTLTGGGSTT
jgi:hypothetical protein